MTDTVAEHPANAPASDHARAPRPPKDRRIVALERLFGERFVHTFQSVYFVQLDHRIECPVGIRLYKKDFEYLSKQLYVEYQFRLWYGYNRELLDRYADIIGAKLTAIDQMLQMNINRLSKLLEQQNFNESLSLFPSPLITDAPIIAGPARAYLNALSKLDRLFALAGTANLVGVIDSQQRALVEMSSKKAFRAFRSILENEVGKLYREAKRVVDEQNGRSSSDPKMTAVVEEQGRALDEFKRDSAQEDLLEPESAVGDADPHQVLQDVAAASAAASAAGASKARRPKAAKPDTAAASAEAPSPAPAPAAAEMP